MKNNLKIIAFLFIFSAFFSACNNKSNTSATNKQPEVKKGVAPIADAEIAVIEMENSAAFPPIKIELYSNIAPKHVARFKELAKEGFFNGTAFHRINESVIQGGDPLSKDENPANDGTGGSDKPDVEAEFSDIPYDTGILGAARSQSFNSANSQFFITLRRQPAFDNKYTIFGKVIDGMSSAKTIAGAPKEGEKPITPVKIKTVTIQAK